MSVEQFNTCKSQLRDTVNLTKLHIWLLKLTDNNRLIENIGSAIFSFRMNKID